MGPAKTLRNKGSRAGGAADLTVRAGCGLPGIEILALTLLRRSRKF
jgi:hypothetical protein